MKLIQYKLRIVICILTIIGLVSCQKENRKTYEVVKSVQTNLPVSMVKKYLTDSAFFDAWFVNDIIKNSSVFELKENTWKIVEGDSSNVLCKYIPNEDLELIWTLKREGPLVNIILAQKGKSSSDKKNPEIEMEVGPVLENILNGLTKSMEKTFSEAGIYCEMVEAKAYLTIREQIPANEKQGVHGRLYGEIVQYMMNAGSQPSAQPIATYYSNGKGENAILDIEAGIPVDSIYEGTSRINYREMSRRKVLRISHFGTYDTLEQSYAKILAFMNQYNIAAIGAPWEEYVTDPGREPDPSKWETKIYFPIN